MISIDVRDEITPFIRSWLQQNPRFIRSLTKSLGWYAQREIKALSRDSRVTSRWPKRTPLKIRRKLDAQAPRQWLGKLRNAIGYQYYEGAVMIGWTSATSAMEGRIQEEGTQRTVTPFLRRFFGQRGVPLKGSTTHINVPARPLFEPAMELVQPKLGAFVSQRVGEYINNGGFVKSAGKGRKYEVFG